MLVLMAEVSTITSISNSVRRTLNKLLNYCTNLQHCANDYIIPIKYNSVIALDIF